MRPVLWVLVGMVAVRLLDAVTDHGLATLAICTVAALYGCVLIFGGIRRLDDDLARYDADPDAFLRSDNP